LQQSEIGFELEISNGKKDSQYEELGDLNGHIFKVEEVPMTLEDITVPKSGQKLKLCGMKISDEDHFVRMTVVQDDKDVHGDAQNMLEYESQNVNSLSKFYYMIRMVKHKYVK
jgi:hypothetical protein